MRRAMYQPPRPCALSALRAAHMRSRKRPRQHPGFVCRVQQRDRWTARHQAPRRTARDLGLARRVYALPLTPTSSVSLIKPPLRQAACFFIGESRRDAATLPHRSCRLLQPWQGDGIEDCYPVCLSYISETPQNSKLYGNHDVWLRREASVRRKQLRTMDIELAEKDVCANTTILQMCVTATCGFRSWRLPRRIHGMPGAERAKSKRRDVHDYRFVAKQSSCGFASRPSGGSLGGWLRELRQAHRIHPAWKTSAPCAVVAVASRTRSSGPL